nr:Chain I, CYS-THR-LYS-SER-ILE-PRO-PRO-CYS [Vigna unguiculata]
CTKSIPPC